LGSPSVITDESGGVVWSADYDTFGDAVNEQGDNDLKYNSKEEDKTGLLYYGARYYNPETGRFITADTVKGNLIDSQSQNRYVYVKNNPLKYIDPTGNAPFGALEMNSMNYADRSDEFKSAYEDCTQNIGLMASSFMSEPLDWGITGYQVATGKAPIWALGVMALPGSAHAATTVIKKAGKIGKVSSKLDNLRHVLPKEVRNLVEARVKIAKEFAESAELEKYLVNRGVDPSTAKVYMFGSSARGVSKTGKFVSEASDIDILISAKTKTGELWSLPAGPNKIGKFKGIEMEVISVRQKGFDYIPGPDIHIPYDNYFKPGLVQTLKIP